MNNLIERLREDGYAAESYAFEVMNEAADKIERLEAVAEAARYVLQKEGQPVSIIALDELDDALEALNKEQT